MFQTYEVFTTGLDGVVPMNYNVFTHWLAGHLSYFLNIPIHHYYNISYPIIFLSFWVFSFLARVEGIYVFLGYKKAIATSSPKSLACFWLIFLYIIFPLLDNIYMRGLLGYHFIQTPTYTIALSMFFAFLESSLVLYKQERASDYWLWIYFPVFSFVLGTAHVAIIAVITAGVGYWLLRKKLIFKWYYCL